MNNIIKPSLLFACVFLVACGGEENGEQSAAIETVIETKDIIAPRNFTFDVGKEITLSMNNQSSSDGALHLYTKAAFTNEKGEAVADPMSRITTIYPNKTREVTLEINGNWKQLYAQWVPMSANESERNLVIPLNQSNNTYHLDL